MKRSIDPVKYLFVLGSCLLTPFTVDAQITWSNPIEYEEDASLESIKLTQGKELTIQLPRTWFSNSITTTLYDKENGTTQSKKLSFPKQSKGMLFKPFYDRLIRLKDKYYFLLRTTDPDRKATLLLAWPFEPETLTLAENPVELMAVPSGYISYSLESDKGKLFILGKQGRSSANEHWFVSIVDSSLQPLFSKEFDLAYNNIYFDVQEFSVTDDESMIFSCTFREGTKHPPVIKPVFFTLPRNGDKLIEIKLDVPGNSSVYLTKYIYEQGSLFAYGLLNSPNDPLAAKGVFFCKFNLYGNMELKPIVRSFPLQTIENSSDALFKGARSIRNLIINNVYFRPDGGYQFIAEQSQSQAFPSTSQSVNYRTVGAVTYKETITVTMAPNWNANNAVFFTIFPDSVKDWYAVLRKGQYAKSTFEKQFISFAHTYDADGKLHVVYNDSADNLQRGEEEKAEWHQNNSKAMSVHATLTPEGKLSKRLLFRYDDTKVKIRTQSVAFDPNGTFTFIGCGPKMYMVGMGKLGL